MFYYNPLFSNYVKTNIGKEFLKIVSKHFPKSGFYGKLFNRNTIKISYSCMPNLEQEISNYNHKTLQNSNEIVDDDKKFCNCRVKSNCPVNGKCLTKGVIYKALTVSHKYKKKIYIGSTGREFKSRSYEHLQSFRSEVKKENTRLIRFILKLNMKY